MAAKVVFAIAAQVLLVQIAFGQTVLGPNAQAYGNYLNDNDVYYANNLAVNLGGVSGSGSAVGLGGSAIGLGGSALGLGGNVIGLGGSALGLGNAGLGLGFNNFGAGAAYGREVEVGLGYGSLGNANLGLGLGGSAIGLGGLGYGAVATPALISSTTLAPFGAYNIVASGPLAVNTVSPIGPSGLAVASENYLEAVLGVSGQLPWLSAVAFEGAVPTAGSGVTTCGCGNGQVGITSQGLGPAPSPFPFPGYGVGGGNIYY